MVVFSSPHTTSPHAAVPCFWDPGFSAFFIVFSAPPNEGQNGHGRSPGRGQEDQMCTKGLQNGGKRETRHPLNRPPCAAPLKKGAMCHPYIICHVLTTSALPEKVTFPLQWASQSEGKSGLRPRSPKNVAKVRQRAPKWRRRGGHGGPRVAQGLQNASPSPPKIHTSTGARSRCPPKGCQGYPRTPKITKIGRFFIIFGENIGGTVPKKRRAFRLLFYTFLVGKSEALYQKKPSKKEASIPFCFLNIFGREIRGGTKKRRAFRPVF